LSQEAPKWGPTSKEREGEGERGGKGGEGRG